MASIGKVSIIDIIGIGGDEVIDRDIKNLSTVTKLKKLTESKKLNLIKSKKLDLAQAKV